MKKELSIVIPAYNEEENIKEVLKKLKSHLSQTSLIYEIIVVNDGSTDQTKSILEKESDIKLINQPYNKGYGSSLKKGSKEASYDWLLFYDGDSQHQPNSIDDLIKYIPEYDMVVGSREGYQGPLTRQPGKKIIKWLSNYLVKKRIPDLNSGLRAVKKEAFNEFIHLYPEGFSLSTTITLAFLKEGFNVKYVPIKINKRKGKSTVSIKDGLKSIMFVLRIITIFSPLRIFLPVIIVLGFLSTCCLIRDVLNFNITDTTVLLFVSTILIFFFSLLADQMAAIRRRLK